MKQSLWLFTLMALFTSSKLVAQFYEVPVYAITSLRPAQSGQEVANLIDNNPQTIYHSRWYENGIPDAITAYFSSNVTSIKKLVYLPRQTGGTNGIFFFFHGARPFLQCS